MNIETTVTKRVEVTVQELKDLLKMKGIIIPDTVVPYFYHDSSWRGRHHVSFEWKEAEQT